jgi:hypothetical protein
VCSIENTETDTQASVWADFKGKQLVISFRGTEQVKFKDILTDINLIQVCHEYYFHEHCFLLPVAFPFLLIFLFIFSFFPYFMSLQTSYEATHPALAKTLIHRSVILIVSVRVAQSKSIAQSIISVCDMFRYLG